MRLLLLLLVFLGGCTIPASRPVTPQQLVALLVQITQADLRTTIDIANSVSPPDTEAAMCASFLQGFVPGLIGTQHTFIPPAGVVSTLETLRIGAMEANSAVGLSLAQHQALNIACGPLAISVESQLATGAIALSSVNPSTFVQMLLALAHANLPFPVIAVQTPALTSQPHPSSIAPPPVQKGQGGAGTVQLPVKVVKLQTVHSEPSADQIAAYGHASLANGHHEWMMH